MKQARQRRRNFVATGRLTLSRSQITVSSGLPTPAEVFQIDGSHPASTTSSCQLIPNQLGRSIDSLAAVRWEHVRPSVHKTRGLTRIQLSPETRQRESGPLTSSARDSSCNYNISPASTQRPGERDNFLFSVCACVWMHAMVGSNIGVTTGNKTRSGIQSWPLPSGYDTLERVLRAKRRVAIIITDEYRL